jgi:putative Mn2+ efflux pump MntP
LDLLFLILIFAGLFAIYDAIRKVNNNMLEQTEELKKIRKELTKINNK